MVRLLLNLVVNTKWGDNDYSCECWTADGDNWYLSAKTASGATAASMGIKESHIRANFTITFYHFTLNNVIYLFYLTYLIYWLIYCYHFTPIDIYLCMYFLINESNNGHECMAWYLELEYLLDGTDFCLLCVQLKNKKKRKKKNLP